MDNLSKSIAWKIESINDGEFTKMYRLQASLIDFCSSPSWKVRVRCAAWTKILSDCACAPASGYLLQAPEIPTGCSETRHGARARHGDTGYCTRFPSRCSRCLLAFPTLHTAPHGGIMCSTYHRNFTGSRLQLIFSVTGSMSEQLV